MASADDYVGLRFGPFIIDRRIGAGAEAEVYLVRYEATQRFLVLRLDANDDRFWEAEPIIPPFNYSIEGRNVRGTFVSRLHRDPLQISIGSHKFFNKSMTVYGVLDLHYLIPLSDPYKVKNSISIRQLLDIAPAENLYFSEFWEWFAMTMMGEAYLVEQKQLDEEEWNQKWKYLQGGTILTTTIRNYLEGGTLTSVIKDAILRRISTNSVIGCELAENLLVRLFDCVLQGSASLETAKATIRCEHFRTNLSSHEIAQFLILCGLLSQIGGNDANLKLTTEILKCLQFQPYSYPQDSEFFEYAFPAGPHEDMQAFIENHGVDTFNLFLQEYAGGRQPFLTITVEEHTHE